MLVTLQHELSRQDEIEFQFPLKKEQGCLPWEGRPFLELGNCLSFTSIIAQKQSFKKVLGYEGVPIRGIRSRFACRVWTNYGRVPEWVVCAKQHISQKKKQASGSLTWASVSDNVIASGESLGTRFGIKLAPWETSRNNDITNNMLIGDLSYEAAAPVAQNSNYADNNLAR